MSKPLKIALACLLCVGVVAVIAAAVRWLVG
jgi:hypothetical protein